jgi:hypothetical protein
MSALEHCFDALYVLGFGLPGRTVPWIRWPAALGCLTHESLKSIITGAAVKPRVFMPT